MPRVLVIDDDVQTCQVVTSVVNAMDCEVVVANDGREGLEQYFAGAFDLVVCDLFLPEVMGYDVCRQIRAQSRTTPIVSMSGICRSPEDAAQFGIPVYGDAFVPKPIEVEVLQEHVRRLLAQNAEPGELVPVFRNARVPPDSVRARWVATLADHIVDAFANRSSGTLILRRAELIYEVRFAHGFPVDVAVPFHRENLGRFLISEGRLSEDEYQQALHVAVSRRIPLEQVFIDLGFVEMSEAVALSRAHKREAITSTFAWSEGGSCEFVENAVDLEGSFQLSPSTLVLDGVARAFLTEELEERYRGLATAHVRAGRLFDTRLTLFAPVLFTTGLQVTVGTELTVRAALADVRGDRVQAMRLLRALELLDVVELGENRAAVTSQEAPDSTAASGDRPATAEEAPASPPSMTAPAPAGMRAPVPVGFEVEDAPAPISPAGSFAAMGAAAIAAALDEPGEAERLSKLYAPPPSAIPEVVVSAPAQRELSPPAEKTMWEETTATANASHYEVLGVANDAAPSILRSALLRALERFDPTGLAPDQARLAEELRLRAAAAYGALADPDFRRIYDARLEGHSLEDFATSLAPPPPAPKPAAPAPPAEDPVETFMKQGRAALERQDFAGAVHAFDEARKRRPQLADAHLFAGLARYRSNPRDPTTIQEAVHEILHSTELAETDAAYFYLGQIFREQGLAHKARQMFGRAVSLNPGNAEAKRALESLGGAAA
jgi:CheY-like chemotaxis protein/tetratricopeptide (TPR) repeat protein